MCFVEAGMAGLQMGGAMIQAYGASQRGKAEEEIMKNNQQLMFLRANDAINRGGIESAIKRREHEQFAARQSAASAAQGVAIDSGSALDLEADTAAIGELDALTIQNNAMREAHGMRVEAVDIGNQIKMKRQERRMNTFTTLLTGGAAAASTAMQGYQAYKARGRTFM